MTVTTPESTSDVRATPRTASAPKAHHTRSRPKIVVVYHAPRQTFRNCDPSISAKIGTTSCPFAENTFYEYYVGGYPASLRVYSPALGGSLNTTCTRGESMVVCTTDDGGVVKFSQAAADRYTQDDADAYSTSPNLGPARSSRSAPSPSYGRGSNSSTSGTPSNGGGGFCSTHDCIPNYPNGNGYTVQCSDGTYSQSGGIQGACSHHGGVG